MASSCSGGPDLDEAQHEAATAAVTANALGAGVSLSEPDQDCVVNELSTTEATGLIGADSEALSSDQSRAMADALISCIGAKTMVRSGLSTFAGDVSPESGECLGESFDQDLFGSLLASQLEGNNQVTTEVEIEISLVLGLCLSPQELLQLHKS